MSRPNSVLRAFRALQGDLDSIDQDEAAAIIGRSTKTLQRWRAIGYGPPYTLASRYVTYSKAVIQTWAGDGLALSCFTEPLLCSCLQDIRRQRPLQSS